MKFIYCGDVVARAGREAVLNNLDALKQKYQPDFIIVNIENAAHGFGATPGICRDFLDKGVDALVTGNHVWQQRELIPFLDECKRIVRPLNYPENLPGKGFCEIEMANGKKLLIIQVLGRLFMEQLINFSKIMSLVKMLMPFLLIFMRKQLQKNLLSVAI